MLWEALIVLDQNFRLWTKCLENSFTLTYKTMECIHAISCELKSVRLGKILSES